jgi:hypothetical protein
MNRMCFVGRVEVSGDFLQRIQTQPLETIESNQAVSMDHCTTPSPLGTREGTLQFVREPGPNRMRCMGLGTKSGQVWSEREEICHRTGSNPFLGIVGLSLCCGLDPLRPAGGKRHFLPMVHQGTRSVKKRGHVVFTLDEACYTGGPSAQLVVFPALVLSRADVFTFRHASSRIPFLAPGAPAENLASHCWASCSRQFLMLVGLPDFSRSNVHNFVIFLVEVALC